MQPGAQETIEPGEMVHLISETNAGYAEQQTRREPRQVATVEEHRPAGEAELQIERRILERTVDEPRPDEIAHAQRSHVRFKPLTLRHSLRGDLGRRPHSPGGEGA